MPLKGLTDAQGLIFHELLPNIFNALPEGELLVCRLVSHSWKYSSSSILRKRQSLRIFFKFCYGDWTFKKNSILAPPPERNQATKVNFRLSELNQLFENGLGDFPCVCFGFLDGDLNTADLVKFFRLFGGQVRQINLGVNMAVDGQSSWSKTILGLVMGQMPALEVLSLTVFSHEGAQLRLSRQMGEMALNDDNTPDNKSTWGVLKLKLLEIGGDTDDSDVVAETTRFLREVVTQRIVFKNLDKISFPYGLHPSFLAVFKEQEDQDAGKRLLCSLLSLGGLIMNLFPETPWDLEQIEYLACLLTRHHPRHLAVKVSSPGFGFGLYPRALNALSRVLQNIPMVTSLKLEDAAAVLLTKMTPNEMIFPLPAVHSLDVSISRGFSRNNNNIEDLLPSSHFPLIYWDNLGLIFPQLRKVQLHAAESQDLETWFPFFNRGHEVETVTSLDIGGGAGSFETVQLCTLLFPRVEHLKISWVQNFPLVAPYIWNGWRRLVELDLSIDIEEEGEILGPAGFFPAYDKALTGLGDETVRRLNLKLTDEQDEEKEEAKVDNSTDEQTPAVGGGIGSVTQLENLRLLRFQFNELAEGPRDSYTFFTAVSGRYAFQQMPDLRVFVSLYREHHRPDQQGILEAALAPLAACPNVTLRIQP